MSSLKDLQDLIHEKFGIAATELDPNESLRGKGVDSLALVEFLFAVEDRFGILIGDDEGDIDTLAELAAVVDKARAKLAA